MDSVVAVLEHGARLLAAGAFVLAALVALTHWAVRSGRLAPFGSWARLVRRFSDPILHPLENRLVRGGMNPQDAPVWLVGITVVAGLILIALVNWIGEFLLTLQAGARQRFLLALAIHTVFQLLRLAILVRVIGSWISASRYSPVMRLAHALTDWLIEPIRRVIPPLGMFDLSPLVAYLLLSLAEQLVIRGFF